MQTRAHAHTTTPEGAAPTPAGVLARGCLRFVAALGCVFAVVAVLVAADFFAAPAQAQFWGWGNSPPPRPRGSIPQQRRPQQQNFGFPFFGGGGGGGWGGGGWGGGRPYQQHPAEERPRQRVDFSRAPAPRRTDAEPPKTVLVLGDSMADWLAYGLEDAFSETEELGVIRKHRTGSSLLRNDPRDYDWAQGARDALGANKADYVVMMIGLADRHGIRERAAAKPANPNEKPSAEEERRAPSVLHEFRSDKWIELYSKRLDEVIAVLKSKKAPVLWVGLPPIRGARARSEISFLNGLFKERAERAGIVFVDVWEGFVDEDGEYSQYGPDVLGQVRRLRAGDGVHFTRYGARKLAHFVDREIKRMLNRETPVALPVPDEPHAPAQPSVPAGPAPRPVAGPVVPLTGGTPGAENLLGARPQDAQAGDPIAVRVLIKGEPPAPQPGRADSFAWPPPITVAADDVTAPPPEPAAATAAARPAQPPPAPPVARRPGQRAASRGTPPPVQ